MSEQYQSRPFSWGGTDTAWDIGFKMSHADLEASDISGRHHFRLLYCLW